MSFEHPCFISYRHHTGNVAPVWIEEFASALSGELQPLTGKDAYIDRGRLQPGYFFNEHLASNLCKSACMVLLFTPTYFDKQHTYCAREYKAMIDLEEARLALLGQGGPQPPYGLIVPVIFRGAQYLPHEIRNERQFENFESYTLTTTKLSRQRGFAERIKVLAQYINDMWRRLDAIDPDPCAQCDGFQLPADADLAAWLPSVLPQPQPFPGR